MKQALLVIDVQNEYFAPHGKWALPDGERALERIQALLAAAREAGAPVFHIVHEALDPQSPVFRPGSEGARMHPAIAVRPGERVITKHVPGAFFQTPLEMYLRQAGVEGVIVCGFMTHMCCDTTTRQARERGFAATFAADATATRDLARDGVTVPHEVVHDTTLAVMTHFASVRDTQAVLAALAAPVAMATTGE